MSLHLKEPLVSAGNLNSSPASPTSEEYDENGNHPIEEKEAFIHQKPHTSSIPFSVPQYDFPQHSSRGNSASLYFFENPTFNLCISGAYVVVAILSIIQGFGILVFGTFRSIVLSLYLMVFGVLTIMYDLRVVAGKFTAEDWFPFLGHNVGRGLTCCFLGLLSSTTSYPTGWNNFILIFSLCVGIAHIVLQLFSPPKTTQPVADTYTDL